MGSTRSINITEVWRCKLVFFNFSLWLGPLRLDKLYIGFQAPHSGREVFMQWKQPIGKYIVHNKTTLAINQNVMSDCSCKNKKQKQNKAKQKKLIPAKQVLSRQGTLQNISRLMPLGAQSSI